MDPLLGLDGQSLVEEIHQERLAAPCASTKTTGQQTYLPLSNAAKPPPKKQYATFAILEISCTNIGGLANKLVPIVKILVMGLSIWNLMHGGITKRQNHTITLILL